MKLTIKSHLLYYFVCSFSLALAAGCGSAEEAEKPGTAFDPMPFVVQGDLLAVRAARDQPYRPLFVKGVNLGVAVPGTRAGELAATREQYDRWLDQMSKAGFNAVRIYTLHYPRFYEALREYNLAHPDRPLYVLHGIWLDEFGHEGDLFRHTEGFTAGVEEVVRCAHGDCQIPHRFGRAYGEFTADISPWVLGWVLGREVAPGEVMLTDEANPNARSFEGEAFRLEEGNATEAWFVEQLDGLVRFERERYGVERPVSVSSWPTLDPLTHPTEGSRFSDEDVARFTLTSVEAIDAPAGLFASYHAYPYYPNFISDDPYYRTFEDEEGPNSYLGYLTELKSHYENMPLLIAEFGLPTSWGNVHWGHSGMNHGGHDEYEQGALAGRMLRTMHTANAAGGAVFAWIDEWWKPTWLMDVRSFPADRRHLWHDATAPEQNYGLIAFDLPEPDWSAPGLVAQGQQEGVERVSMIADASFLHLRLELDRPLAEEERLVVGLDTYGDDLGEVVLPDGAEGSRGHELALVLKGPDEAQLHVTRAYNLQGIWHDTSTDEQLYRSVPSRGAGWRPVLWQTDQAHGSDDGQYRFDATYFDAGNLRVRRAEERPSRLDAVIVDGTTLDIRLPWTLLQFTDPSQLEVMHDDRSTEPEREVMRTEGVAVAVSRGERVVVETERLAWQPWDVAPESIEREKASLEIFGEAMRALPTWLEE